LAAFSWESRERRAILPRHQILDLIKLADTPERRLVRHMLSMRDQDSTGKLCRSLVESANEGFGTSAPGSAEMQVAPGAPAADTVEGKPMAPLSRRGRPATGLPVNGRKLKELRGSFSQEDFADKCGVSTSSIQRGENGARLNGTILDKIAATLAELLGKPIRAADLTSN
jgi:DNA-binding XRE family transcriptional regulator